MSSRLLRVLVCLGPLVGCGEDGDRSRIPDADGVPQLIVEEDLRIGSVDDPDEGFSRIAGVVVGPDRRIYVAEGQDLHVRIYDATGRLERVVGGRGSGPGEFQSVSRPGLLGDTLWIVDLGNGRISVFDRDGELLGSVPAHGVFVATPGQSVRLYPARLRPDGLWSSQVLMGVGPDGVSLSIPELLFDDSGAVVDTLRQARFEVPPMWVVVDSVSINAEYGLFAHPLIANVDDGTVIVHRLPAESPSEGRFTVVRTDLAGDTILNLELRYDPQPVDAEYVAGVVDALGSGPQGVFGTGRIERAVRSVLPPFYPPISVLRVGEDNSVWLRRHDDGQDRWRYLVIEPDGSLRGEVLVPRGSNLAWTGPDEFLAVEPDSFEVPWLVRYRIR